MFAAQHQYMTVIGDCYAASETWSFGMRLSDGGVSNSATALAIAPYVEAWWRGTGVAAANAFKPLPPWRLTELTRPPRRCTCRRS
jgi:hypothetical protein